MKIFFLFHYSYLKCCQYLHNLRASNCRELCGSRWGFNTLLTYTSLLYSEYIFWIRGLNYKQSLLFTKYKNDVSSKLKLTHCRWFKSQQWDMNLPVSTVFKASLSVTVLWWNVLTLWICITIWGRWSVHSGWSTCCISDPLLPGVILLANILTEKKRSLVSLSADESWSHTCCQLLYKQPVKCPHWRRYIIVLCFDAVLHFRGRCCQSKTTYRYCMDGLCEVWEVVWIHLLQLTSK